jgi:hypothetical protein
MEHKFHSKLYAMEFRNSYTLLILVFNDPCSDFIVLDMKTMRLNTIKSCSEPAALEENKKTVLIKK